MSLPPSFNPEPDPAPRKKKKSKRKTKYMSVQEACDYISDTFEVEYTRQTVYNWIKHGKKGRMLNAKLLGHSYYLTKRDIHEFFHTY